MTKRVHLTMALAAMLALTGAANAQGLTLSNADMPKTFTFEDGGDADYWTLDNGTNGWFIGTAAYRYGSNGLYISNDNGATNAYTNNSTTKSHAYLTLDLSEGGEYEIGFDWKSMGENNYDYLEVYWCTSAPTAGSTPSGTRLGSRLQMQSSWQTFYQTMTITDDEVGTYYLVLCWTNDYSAGDNPPASVDNFSFGKLTCLAPVNISFASISNEGATVNWTPVGDEAQWAVYVDGEEVDGSPVFEPTIDLAGYEANTTYGVSVRAVCDEGDTSMAANGQFRTLCQNGNCEVTLQVSQYSYAGTVSVRQNGDELANVAFSYSSGTSASVEICNGDSLVMVYTAPSYSYSTTTWTVYDAGETPLATFTNGTPSGTTVLAVASACPSCMPVQTVHHTASDITQTVISWTDPYFDDASQYLVEVDGVQYAVSGDTTYNLSTYPMTHYELRVARLCDGEDTSAWRDYAFNSPCDESVYAPVPFSSSFEELNTNESPDCWVQVQTGGNAGLGAVFPSAYRWAPNAHTGSVYFEFESANGNETEVLALPRMEDVSTLQLSFYAATTTDKYNFMLEAGVVELDDEGNYTFVPVDTVELFAGESNQWASSYRVYNVLFDTYEGAAERLAIRTSPTNGSMYTLMIDDFNVIRVGVPVLGPFEGGSNYTINMYDTLSLNANLMTGEVEDWIWSSDMLTSGDAVIVEQDTSSVKIVYNAAGSDLLTVTAHNSNGDATRSVMVNIIDNTLVDTYPYSTGFESDEDRSWFTAGDLNGWYIGQAVAYEGTSSLYISRDNGATNMMADGLTCRSYAYRHIEITEANEYMLSFMWKGNGSSSSYINAYLADTIVHPTAGSSPSYDWTQIGTSCTLAADWTESSSIFFAEPGQYTVILYWYGTGNSNPPHAVDNISIAPVTCPTPRDLAVVDMQADNITLGWTVIGDESAWQLKVDNDDWIDVGENPFTLTDLLANNSYSVQLRAVCGDGDTSLPTAPLAFRTACEGDSCQVTVAFSGYGFTTYELIQNGCSYGSTTSSNSTYRVCAGEPLYLRTSPASYSTTRMIISNMADIELYNSSLDLLTTDTVDLGNPCPSCLPAVGIHAESVTSTSVTVSWSAMGSNTDWALYLDGQQVGSADDSTYTFNGLTANTAYTVGVRALCDDGDTSVMRTATVRTACDGGNCEFTVVLADTYGDGWNGSAIEVYQNGSLFTSLTIASGNNAYTETVAPCLGDPIVLLWHSGSYDYECSFTVTDADGNTLLSSGSMRNHYTGDSIMLFDGQCNDTVLLSGNEDPQTGCDAPTALNATPGETEISITFSGMAGSYEVGIVEGSAWDEYSATTEEVFNPSHTFTGLTANTEYTIGVRSVCEDDWDYIYSDWVTVTVSTTGDTAVQEQCFAPMVLQTVSVDSTQATISWTPSGDEEQWQLMINGDSENLVDVSTTTYVMSNLTPATQYRVRVRAVCSETNFSGWSNELSFTTDSVDNSGSQGIVATDARSFMLTPNPASGSVVLKGVSDGTRIDIVDLNGRTLRTFTAHADHVGIDLGGMAAGTYFLRLSSSTDTAVLKLIVK